MKKISLLLSLCLMVFSAMAQTDPCAGTITGTAKVCVGMTTILSNSISGGTWSSSNIFVATVSGSGDIGGVPPGSGVVKGISPGTARITYTVSGSEGCSGYTIKIVTVNALPNAGTITMESTDTVCVNSTIRLLNSVSGGAWSSANIGIAKVDGGGHVKGVSAGTVNISYKITSSSCGIAAAVKTVTSIPSPSAIAGPAYVIIGTPVTLSDTTSGGTWTSSAPALATVGASGIVTGLSVGTSNISYTMPNGCYRARSMDIYASASDLPIHGQTEMCLGIPRTLTSDNPGGVWSSSNSAVVTINPASGMYTGLAVGTATISYTFTGGIQTTIVSIVSPVPSVGPMTGPSSMCPGDSITLTTTGAGGTWRAAVSTAAIATVNSTGIVTGLTPGTSVIIYEIYNGCGGTGVSKVVTVNPVPGTTTITGASKVCVGDVITLGNIIGGGTWSSSTTSVGTVASSGVVAGAAAGTTIISYAVANSCGSAILTKTVTVESPPNAGTITGPSNVDEGASISLSSTVAGGVWASASTDNAAVDSFGEVTGVAAGTTAISYTVGNVCGTATTTKAVTVNSLASFSGDLIVCAGSTTSLLSSLAGGTWSSDNIARATVSTAGVVTGVSAGTTTISYNISGSISTAIVTVNATPAAITGTTSVCVGTSTWLGNAVAGGAWSSDESSVVAVDAVGAVTGVSPGTGTIVYTLSNGCSATTVVSVNATPDAIDGIASVCVGAVTALSNSLPGGTWSSGNTAIATVGTTGNVTGVAFGTTLISYTNGTCRVTRAVTVLAVPAGVGGVAKACLGATTTLNNATAGGAWSTGDPDIATINSAGVLTGVAAGTVDVFYTLPNTCSKSVVATVNPNPSGITGTFSLCQAATTTLANATPVLLQWSSSDPSKATVSATGVVTGQAAGTANITYKVTTGCYTTAIVTVNANPASITGMLTACPGSTTTLNNALAGGSWSSSNTGVATADVSSGVVTGVAWGTTVISYTHAGCSKSVIVTINGTPAISGTGTVCVNRATTLTCSPGASSWTSGNTSVATVSGGIVTGITGGTALITATAATGCKASTIVSVNALPPTITGVQSVCVGNTTSLSNAVTGGIWASSATTVGAIGTNGVVTGLAAGTTIISYTSDEGCVRTANVTVNALPATITGTPAVCVGTNATLGSATAGGTWSSLSSAIATVGSTGIVTGVSSGTATVDYALGNGCSRTAIATVNATPAAIGGTSSVCVGAVTTLNNSTTGGTWTSSNATVATIGTAGNVTGVAFGTTMITYAFGSCRATRLVTVLAVPAGIGGVAKACPGSTTNLNNATAGGAWSSSDPGIATINSSGMVTGIVAGTAEVVYTMPNTCSKSVVVTINPTPSGITGTLTLCQAATTTLANATPVLLQWSSSDPSKATVSSTGVVTGQAGGTATITYKVTTGCYTTAVVTVNTVPPITGITEICKTATTPLINTGAGLWSSLNPGVATIASTTGIVTGVDAGTSIIVFTATNGCTAAKVVSVSNCGSRGIAAAGIATSDLNIQVAIFPNPSTGMFNISTPEQGRLSVLALDGKEVASYEIVTGSTNMILPKDLATGVYICRFNATTGATMTVRLVYEAQ